MYLFTVRSNLTNAAIKLWTSKKDRELQIRWVGRFLCDVLKYVCVLRVLTLGCLPLFARQVVIKLAPVTEWRPNKQPSTHSSNSATVADMLRSLSIGDNSETCNEVKDCSQDGAANPQAPSCGNSPASGAWEGTSTELGLWELWRPSPKVAGGAAGGESQGSSLCKQGVLAAQGNLQPRGKVVFILEKNHREDHMGSLVLSNPLRADGNLSDRDSFVMFHPADRRFPYMLIARGDLPSLFVDVSPAFFVPYRVVLVYRFWLPRSLARTAITLVMSPLIALFLVFDALRLLRGMNVEPRGACQLDFHGVRQVTLGRYIEAAVGTPRALRWRSWCDTPRDRGFAVTVWAQSRRFPAHRATKS